MKSPLSGFCAVMGGIEMFFWVSFILSIFFLILSFFVVGFAGLLVFILGFLLLGFSVGWFVRSRCV